MDSLSDCVAAEGCTAESAFTGARALVRQSSAILRRRPALSGVIGLCHGYQPGAGQHPGRNR